jgi:hypothetical protein
MGKKKYFWIVGIVLVIGAFFIFSGTGKSYEAVENFDGEVTIYKSSSCGCCGIYGNYFQRKGNDDVEIINLENVDSIKQQYGVPPGLGSCHTTIIGDYFVEGHIPLEAVEKLLLEKPDIAGIAMPGMPSGSPGMPGAKRGDFVIYAVNHDGSYEEFMRI